MYDKLRTTFGRHEAAKRAWSLIAASVVIVATSATAHAQRVGDLFLVPDIVNFRDGESMPAERGYFFVPENRNKPDSKLIAIAVMRFRTTAAEPGEPVFMLAGGPGSSLIAPLKTSGRRYNEPSPRRLLIEDLRAVGDVVIPDQRGAGLSLPFMNAPARPRSLPVDKPLTPEVRAALTREAARATKQAWLDQGRDVDGYHATQLADDVDALREAMGYEKISIYGGSFGSQSTFTIVRRHPEMVSRILVWGIEDIDHTFDMPSEILASIKQILADAEQDADIAPHVPEGGILAAVARVIDELKAKPAMVTIADPHTGEDVEVAIGPEEFKLYWPAGAWRDGPQSWPGSLLPALAGDFSTVAQAVFRIKSGGGTVSRSPTAMFWAMDCGLAPSAKRLERLQSDPAIALLGDINLSYYAASGEWNAPDVSEAFKAPIKTDLPALFLHGTCDTSTPLANALSTSAGYSQGHLVVVERATHSVISELYREKPEFIRPLVAKFLSGQSIDGTPSRITLPPAEFLGPGAVADSD